MMMIIIKIMNEEQAYVLVVGRGERWFDCFNLCNHLSSHLFFLGILKDLNENIG